MYVLVISFGLSIEAQVVSFSLFFNYKYVLLLFDCVNVLSSGSATGYPACYCIYMLNSWILSECVCGGAIEKERTGSAEIDKQYLYRVYCDLNNKTKIFEKLKWRVTETVWCHCTTYRLTCHQYLLLMKRKKKLCTDFLRSAAFSIDKFDTTRYAYAAGIATKSKEKTEAHIGFAYMILRVSLCKSC